MTDEVEFGAPLVRAVDDLSRGRAVVDRVRAYHQLAVRRPVQAENVRGARRVLERLLY